MPNTGDRVRVVKDIQLMSKRECEREKVIVQRAKGSLHILKPSPPSPHNNSTPACQTTPV
jgi:hypothetical protein